MGKRSSGLDINAGNLSSKNAFEWAKTTFQNRSGRRGEIGQLSDGAFSNILLFGNERIGIASDGIGTKIEIAERTGIFRTMGFDLVAMVADDLATAGFEPTNISNVIDVNTIDHDKISDMMKGFADACSFAGIAITGGEIAELGSRVGGYGDFNVNWSSTAIGHLPEGRDIVDGGTIREGQAIIALKSHGFRSNGFSLIRKVMIRSFGQEWHLEAYDNQRSWGEKLLTPSLIYSPLINRLLDSRVAVTGIAHVTGGGIEDNLGRALKPSGCGAELDNLFPPLEVMKKVMDLGSVSDEDAYLYWNMGNGMFVIVDSQDVEKVMDIAKKMNYNARKAGTITGQQGVNRL